MVTRAITEHEDEFLGQAGEGCSRDVAAEGLIRLLLWTGEEVRAVAAQLQADGLIAAVDADTYRVTESGRAAYAEHERKAEERNRSKVLHRHGIR